MSVGKGNVYGYTHIHIFLAALQQLVQKNDGLISDSLPRLAADEDAAHVVAKGKHPLALPGPRAIHPRTVARTTIFPW